MLMILIATSMVATLLTGCGKSFTVSKECKMELGTPIVNYQSEFVDIKDKKELNKAEFDFSEVNIYKVGKYDASVKLGKESKDFKVEVEDTVAPTIKLNDKICAGVGAPVYLSEMISSITEASGVAKVSFDENTYEEETESTEESTENAEVTESSEEAVDSTEIADYSKVTKPEKVEYNDEAVKYDIAGEYDNKVFLEDESGNKNEYVIHIVVSSLPVISNATDMVVQKGSEVDYLYGVSAKDGGGNDLEITVDSSSVDVNTVGEYKVVYSVVDSNGIEAKEEVKVTVVDDIDVSLSGDTDTVRAVSNGETLGGTEMREKIDITKAQESANKGTTSSQSKPSNQNSGSQGSNSSTNSSGSQSSEESYVDTRPSAPDIQAQSVGEGSVGTCTPAQKAYIDGLVGTWKNGGMSNSQLIDSILAYFDEQGVQSSGSGCMLNNKFLVTSVEQAKSIQKFNLNASFIYSYASTYLDGTADETGKYLNCSETYVNIW